MRKHYTDKMHSTICLFPGVQTVIGVFQAFVNFLVYMIIFPMSCQGHAAHDKKCDEVIRLNQRFYKHEKTWNETTDEEKVKENNLRLEQSTKFRQEAKGDYARLLYGIFDGVLTATPVVGTLLHAHRLYYEGTDPTFLQRFRPVMIS